MDSQRRTGLEAKSVGKLPLFYIRLISVKYWAYLVGKLLVVGALSAGLLWTLRHYWPVDHYWIPVFTPRVGYHLVERLQPPRFASDLGYTGAVGVWFLVSCGLLYLAILDQWYRCRVCLRRLRMPIQTGSWSSMLQGGRPKIEYICTFGHGRLNVEQLQIAGQEAPEWTPQREDPWDELCTLMKQDGKS